MRKPSKVSFTNKPTAASRMLGRRPSDSATTCTGCNRRFELGEHSEWNSLVLPPLVSSLLRVKELGFLWKRFFKINRFSIGKIQTEKEKENRRSYHGSNTEPAGWSSNRYTLGFVRLKLNGDHRYTLSRAFLKRKIKSRVVPGPPFPLPPLGFAADGKHVFTSNPKDWQFKWLTNNIRIYTTKTMNHHRHVFIIKTAFFIPTEKGKNLVTENHTFNLVNKKKIGAWRLELEAWRRTNIIRQVSLPLRHRLENLLNLEMEKRSESFWQGIGSARSKTRQRQQQRQRQCRRSRGFLHANDSALLGYLGTSGRII